LRKYILPEAQQLDVVILKETDYAVLLHLVTCQNQRFLW